MLKLGRNIAIATIFAACALPALAQQTTPPADAQCADEATGDTAPCDPAPAAKRVASPAFLAGRQKSAGRMRECGAQWKTAKADPAVKGAGWPHYWSECNKRLKAAAAQ